MEQALRSGFGGGGGSSAHICSSRALLHLSLPTMALAHNLGTPKWCWWWRPRVSAPAAIATWAATWAVTNQTVRTTSQAPAPACARLPNRAVMGIYVMALFLACGCGWVLTWCSPMLPTGCLAKASIALHRGGQCMVLCMCVLMHACVHAVGPCSTILQRVCICHVLGRSADCTGPVMGPLWAPGPAPRMAWAHGMHQPPPARACVRMCCLPSDDEDAAQSPILRSMQARLARSCAGRCFCPPASMAMLPGTRLRVMVRHMHRRLSRGP